MTRTWGHCVAIAVVLGALAVGAGTALGEENSMSHTRTIDREVTVDAPRPEVWKAFTTTQGATTFFASAAHIELRLNGPYEIYFDMTAPAGQRGSEGCKVLSFVPEEMLSFTWNAPPKFPDIRRQRTFVVIRFSEAGQGRTKVTITHAGWGEGEQWDAVFAYFQPAWGRVLANLQQRFESGPLEWGEPGIPGPTQAEPSESGPTHAEQPTPRHFVYFIRPAREGFFDKPTPQETDAVSRHAAYIKRLLDEGTLVLAGPCFDPPAYPATGGDAPPLEMPTPGIVVFEAANIEEARKIMEADPAVCEGVFKARVNSFRLAFGRK